MSSPTHFGGAGREGSRRLAALIIGPLSVWLAAAACSRAGDARLGASQADASIQGDTAVQAPIMPLLHAHADLILEDSTALSVKGWVEFAHWWSSDAITSLSGSWTVPPPPEAKDSQTLFLFLGLQDDSTKVTELLQPVLQWGLSPAGGGDYWSLSCWYLHVPALQKPLLTASTAVRVAEGESIDGYVRRREMNDTLSVWECGAKTDAGVSTGLAVISGMDLRYSYAALEAYGKSMSCDHYPDARLTAFTDIRLDTDWQPVDSSRIQWDTTVVVPGCSHRVDVKGASEIDLHY